MAPGGTVATVARNWGQRAGLLDTVRRATRDVPPLRTLQSPTLRVVGDGERVGFIFGTGLVARFFERYYAAGAGGYAAAARIVARIFVGSFVTDAYSRSVLEPLPCRITVDDRTLEPDAFSLVVASVVKDLGLHMWVTHRARRMRSGRTWLRRRSRPERSGPRRRACSSESRSAVRGTSTVWCASCCSDFRAGPDPGCSMATSSCRKKSVYLPGLACASRHFEPRRGSRRTNIPLILWCG